MAEVAALIRLGHLIISSILGFGCIYLGYRLFGQISATVTNDGKFKLPGVGEISFKAAPGIFFAAFGAYIMYSAVEKTVNITGPTGLAYQGAPPAVPIDPAHMTSTGTQPFTYIQTAMPPQPPRVEGAHPVPPPPPFPATTVEAPALGSPTPKGER